MIYCTFHLQMTCDHECMITSLDAKWPGSVHDSRIFRESVLCQRFEEGKLHLVQNTVQDTVHNTLKCSF